MKREELDEAVNRAHLNWANTSRRRALGLTRCDVAELLHMWLTELIMKPGTSWLQRQILGTVRGYVQGYLENC